MFGPACITSVFRLSVQFVLGSGCLHLVGIETVSAKLEALEYFFSMSAENRARLKIMIFKIFDQVGDAFPFLVANL